jgi:hypothetical protein
MALKLKIPPIRIQNKIRSLYGSENIIYRREKWPESKFPLIDGAASVELAKSDFDRSKKTLARTLRISFEMGDVVWAACLMMFFRVKCFLFKDINLSEWFINFTDTFPAGCFERLAKDAVISPATKFNPAYLWCIGQPKIQLIRTTLRFQEEWPGILQSVCYLIAAEQQSIRDVGSLLRAIRDLNVKQDTIEQLMLAFNTHRLINDNRQHSPIVFPYLFLHHYSSLYLVRPFIPRPMWSRRNHATLTIRTLNREALLILKMQKFRYADFPLHKDLIDTLISCVFTAHLDDLENECLDQKNTVRTLMEMSIPDRRIYCLRQEVFYNDSETSNGGFGYNSMADALEASTYPELAERIRVDYYQDIVNDLPRWAGVPGGLLHQLYGMFPLATDETIYDAIIKYYQGKSIPLLDLYLGTVKLGQSDMQGISSSLRSDIP